MHHGEHEIRVGGEDGHQGFTERIERDAIIISYIGLENEQIVQDFKGRENHEIMVNQHDFHQDRLLKISNHYNTIPNRDNALLNKVYAESLEED